MLRSLLLECFHEPTQSGVLGSLAIYLDPVAVQQRRQILPNVPSFSSPSSPFARHIRLNVTCRLCTALSTTLNRISNHTQDKEHYSHVAVHGTSETKVETQLARRLGKQP